MRRPSPRVLLGGAAVLMASVAGCRHTGSVGAERVTVFAAASLADAFAEVATGFEATSRGVAVELNFAASSALREQILAGAPADVFASANAATMAEVVEAGAAADAVDFVANRLQIAVPAGNPAGVTSLHDFAEPELLLGLCVEEAPCGELARRALAGAGVSPSIDTHEADVRSLLTKVEEGELDAGIVYRSDVLTSASIEGIPLPPEADATAAYPIAVLTGAANSEGGIAFVAYVLSDEGQTVLAAHGFEVP